jgi:hypothetical protein
VNLEQLKHAVEIPLPAGRCHKASSDATGRSCGRRDLRRRRCGDAPPRPAGTAEAGTAAVGAVAHLLATAIEEGRGLSSMSGILADSSYRLLPA